MPTVRMAVNKRAQSGLYTRVSIQDWCKVRNHSWSVSRGYAYHTDLGRLSRYILGLKKGDPRQADHTDRDRLNNTRSNLRVVTHAQNGQNKSKQAGTSSRYRGVSWHKGGRKWMAEVEVQGKKTYLGLFTDEERAGEAAREARKRILPFATD